MQLAVRIQLCWMVEGWLTATKQSERVQDERVQLLSHTAGSSSCNAQMINSASLCSFSWQSSHCSSQHSPTLLHQVTPTPDPPQRSDFAPICLLLVGGSWQYGSRTIPLDYAGKSWGNPSPSLCLCPNTSIQFPPSCLPVASDRNVLK